jgi:TorA maturation chaperone TorD
MAQGEALSGAAPEISEEDRARAACYALMSRFFYAPPDSHLLAEICNAPLEAGAEAPAGGMGAAWSELQEACRNAFPAVIRQEYDTLFIGVGKALVTPYTSRYARQSAPDRHLVRLREQLEAWGLARRERVFETEDHISGICDVMRHLIEQDYPLEEQRRCFEEFVYPGVMPLFDAIDAVEAAGFYRHIALFSRRFIEVEREGFAMLD